MPRQCMHWGWVNNGTKWFDWIYMVFSVVLALRFILMCFAHGHVHFRYLWEYYHSYETSHTETQLTLSRFIINIWYFYPYHNTFMSEIWAFCLFVMVCHEFFWTADTRSTYDSPPKVYTKTPVKWLPHLFLRKMDWLSRPYLASFIQHV